MRYVIVIIGAFLAFFFVGGTIAIIAIPMFGTNVAGLLVLLIGGGSALGTLISGWHRVNVEKRFDQIMNGL